SRQESGGHGSRGVPQEAQRDPRKVTADARPQAAKTTPPMSSATPLVEVRNVRKHFPGVQALDGVSLHVGRCEVVAVVGENGAGKSTLTNILAGIHRPDAGEFLLDGRPMRLGGVREALRHGIVLIHQELNLAENLSVAANLFLGREKVLGGFLGLLAAGRMNAE